MYLVQVTIAVEAPKGHGAAVQRIEDALSAAKKAMGVSWDRLEVVTVDNVSEPKKKGR